MSVDGKQPGQDTIDDKYNHSGNSQIKPQPDEEDQRDETTVRRENFLSIYKEGENKDDGEEDGPDLSNGIKFKRDEENEDEFKLKTSKENESGKKPLIQELE